MKNIFVRLLLLLLSLALFFNCEEIPVVDFPDPCLCDVLLTVNKIRYSTDDRIVVTLKNLSSQPVFLQGCSPIMIATKTDTGWEEAPLVVCIWEGIAQKVDPGQSYKETLEAKNFKGTHKFFAPVYYECVEGKPISEAECTGMDKIYSPIFIVN